jgi:hypothetical protein
VAGAPLYWSLVRSPCLRVVFLLVAEPATHRRCGTDQSSSIRPIDPTSANTSVEKLPTVRSSPLFLFPRQWHLRSSTSPSRRCLSVQTLAHLYQNATRMVRDGTRTRRSILHIRRPLGTQWKHHVGGRRANDISLVWNDSSETTNRFTRRLQTRLQ